MKYFFNFCFKEYRTLVSLQNGVALRIGSGKMVVIVDLVANNTT